MLHHSTDDAKTAQPHQRPEDPVCFSCVSEQGKSISAPTTIKKYTRGKKGSAHTILSSTLGTGKFTQLPTMRKHTEFVFKSYFFNAQSRQKFSKQLQILDFYYKFKNDLVGSRKKWIIAQYIFPTILCTFAAVFFFFCEKSANLHGNQQDNHCFPVRIHPNKTY